MKIEWVAGSRISVNADKKGVTISANREGLLSIACHLQSLAESM